jgi:hypothetical protein
MKQDGQTHPDPPVLDQTCHGSSLVIKGRDTDPQSGRSNPGTNPDDRAKSLLWLGIREGFFQMQVSKCPSAVIVPGAESGKLRVTITDQAYPQFHSHDLLTPYLHLRIPYSIAL